MSHKIYDKISKEIEKKILDKKFKPGDRIPSERALASEFEVSRNTVREALKILVEKKVLIVKTGAGNYVSQDASKLISSALMSFTRQKKKRLSDVFELRKIIEPETAAIASQRIKPEYIEKLENSISEQKKALDTKAFRKADRKFHKIIAKSASNSVLISLYEKIESIIEESRSDELLSPERLEKSLENHKKILEAIKNRDSKKSYKMMKKHMEDIEKTLI
jgi:GntR family transcriptional repressor for pyruvate dehydrogenase complex